MRHPASLLSRLRRAAAALCALALAALPAAAQGPGERSALERRHLAEIRARYAQPAWPRGETRQGLPNALALPGWTADPLQSERGLLTRSYRRAEAEAPSFVLETFVADGAPEAQELLVGWLAGLQSAQRMPSAREAGLAVGDAGFVGRSGAGPRALAWIAFVRGNVAVRVSACDATREPELDLAAVAAAADLAILQAPLQEDGGAPPKPEIRALAAPRAAAAAGEVLRLTVDVADPAQGAPHLQWVVGGPGQGYVERSAAGHWEFHATGPGAVTLALEVTGSTGTFARREIALVLADD